MMENEMIDEPKRGQIFIAHLENSVHECEGVALVVADADELFVIDSHYSSSYGWSKEDMVCQHHLDNYEKHFPQGYDIYDIGYFPLSDTMVTYAKVREKIAELLEEKSIPTKTK